MYEEHNALDGDQAAMQTALKIPDFTADTTAYATGGSSTSKGKFRTLQGFSTKAKGKMYEGCPGCPYKHYKMFYDYYSDFDYADKWVSAALGGTDMTFTSGKFGPNNFATMHTDARVEAAKKGSAYMNVWMYAVREFEDAIDDCTSCVADCNAHSTNSGSVHAWDEGVAFYAGSLEGTAQGGNTGGAMVYRLAEKRCANFGTCGAAGGAITGQSQVNSELFKAAGLFATGRDLLQQGHCAKVRPVVEQIVSIMTVPLVQGTLRYAYKVGNVANDQSAKNAAEGSTFAAAVLPMVHHCNAASATIVANHMKFGLVFGTDGTYVSGTLPDFAAVKSALEDTYACLGITCAHVGALNSVLDKDVAIAAKCTHASATIAGYFPGSDVTQHNALDKDQAAMAAALKTADFTAATAAYATGGVSTTNSACVAGQDCFNSMSKGKARTLKGFSTKAEGKMYDGAALKDGGPALACPGCPYKHYKMFYDYYSDFDYADKWVSAALAGTDMTFTSGKFGPNAFSGMHVDARVEAAKKGP